MMKKALFLSCVLALLVPFFGCAEQAPASVETVRVTLVDSPYVDTPQGNTFAVERHSDLTVRLAPHTNYYIADTTYPGAALTPDGTDMLLTLPDVAYPVRVELVCQEGDTVIRYEGCGGTVAGTGQTSYEALYDLTHHTRPNTSQGTDLLTREGYTLTAWSTGPDGTGDRVGLGSRVTVPKGQASTLYAVWEPWTDASAFTFTSQSDGTLLLTGYTGDGGPVVVPQTVDGQTVTGIAAGAFAGADVTRVVLPPSLQTIQAGAFTGSALTELTFFDGVLEVCDASFADCPDFSTVHINAIQHPRYAAFDRYSTYADKVDNLILHQDTPKLVLFGGSGTYYSLDACTMTQELAGYEVFNLGVNAWFNGQAQLEIMLPYFQPGDVLLHAPEMMSEYQFLARNDMGIAEGKLIDDTRFFCCLELNYDLLANLDLRHVTGFFDTFAAFNRQRQELPFTNYTDYELYADSRGDCASARFVTVEKVGSISGEAGLNMDLVSDETMAALDRYYDRFAARGCTVLRAFACENADGLTATDRQNIPAFAAAFAEKSAYPVVNRLEDVLYPTTWFCDTDWHLTYEHAVENTRALADALRPYLEEGDLWNS